MAQRTRLWNKLDDTEIRNSELQRSATVRTYEAFELKVAAMKSDLATVPKRRMSNGRSGKRIDFPDANGHMESYLIREVEIMHPDLARKYPENRSYVGISIKDKSKRIHFSMNEIGLYGMIRDYKGSVQYIEPLTRDKKKYKVFYRKDMEGATAFECFTKTVQSNLKFKIEGKDTDDGKLRTYRLALAATGEYSQFQIVDQNAENASDAEKKSIVLSAMTAAMTRVNAVFENDLAISMQLVVKNEDIIYLDPTTDPYDNFDGEAMLSQNQTNCDNVIEPANYDIGHVLSTGGGGIATGASVCENGAKARGVTGSPFPLGDDFYFDFIAHEMGHQFGANHTFNGDEGSCAGDNRYDPTAVEPGSGSTLMAYAGLCGTQNVQSNSDMYFHIISVDEIRNYVVNGAGASCAVVTDFQFNLNAPVVNAGDDFMIPKGTPYRLTGSGSDTDGDIITFNWEQIDNEITQVPPSETAVSGALYRSFNPSLDPVRYMPQLKTLVTGDVSSTWEVTPGVGREMNFRLSVRDNNTEAGQVVTDDVTVTVSDVAGPFLVNSQNTEDQVWTPGGEETITWDVAGTTANSINVSQVNILLSTDGGSTFSTVLASGVDNDGEQVITVPDIKASQCFVMVEAVGNFFFSMNAKSFSIGSFNEVCKSYTADDVPVAIPDNNPNGAVSIIEVADDISVENIRVILIDQSNPSVNSPGIAHTYLGDLNISLESPNGTVVELLSSACDASEDIEAVFSDEGDPLNCNNFSPGISGIVKPVEHFSAFNGENAQGNWVLKVVDGAEVDTGFIDAWSLEICTSEAVLGVNNYVFDEFKVYPNPSEGLVKVQFESDESGDVEILVYDLLGQTVEKKNYRNPSTRFEESLDLSHLEGGIYILSAKRGNKMSSYKIRIQ